MAGPPELKRADARHQNVEDERGRPDNRRRQTEQRHHRDIPRCTSMTDAGIKKGDHEDAQGQKQQMLRHCLRHITSSGARASTFPNEGCQDQAVRKSAGSTAAVLVRDWKRSQRSAARTKAMRALSSPT